MQREVRGLPYGSFPAEDVFVLQQEAYPERAEGQLESGSYLHSPSTSSSLAGVRWSMISVAQRALSSGDVSVHRSPCLGAAAVGCCVLWTSSCSKTGRQTTYLILIFV